MKKYLQRKISQYSFAYRENKEIQLAAKQVAQFIDTGRSFMENYLYNETTLLIPFVFEGGARKWMAYFEECQLNVYWKQAEKVDSKYFLQHVCNKENGCLHYRYLDESMILKYGEEIQMETVLTKYSQKEIHKIILSGISLFYFPTGIGFLSIHYRYIDGESLRNVVNISAVFSRFWANEAENGSARTVFFIRGKRILLKRLLLEMLAVKPCGRVQFYPNTNGKRAFVFQRLLNVSPKGNEKIALRRNLWISDEESDDKISIEDLEEDVALEKNRVCYFSPTTMCVVTKSLDGDMREQERRQANIRYSYFYLYLLALHEQQALLFYDQQVVNIGKKIANVTQMKNRLLRFMPTYSFRVVSMEVYYQKIFMSLRSVLRLDDLEHDISENINMLNEEYRQRSDRLMNTFLAILSLFGLVSVVTDALAIVECIVSGNGWEVLLVLKCVASASMICLLFMLINGYRHRR